jgi:uncharacterized protein
VRPRIYFDTMLFSYFIENHAEFGPRVKHQYDRIQERGHTICTSTFTLGELLTGPEKRGHADGVAAILQAVRPPAVELIALDASVAARSAIRAQENVTPPDAIHLASAAHAGVTLFLTNDHGLKRLRIPGIGFIAGLDANIF